MEEVGQSEQIKRAAELILAADFMIVATGAGMSADSGLPVYQDTQKVEAYIKRRLTYRDLCTPNWNFEEPETFYGFWGSSMKMYREAVPHQGYHILKRWREQLFSESPADFQEVLMRDTKFKDVTNPPGPFFVYTSNVDALHLKTGFGANEVYEIHGNIETWQCSALCTEDTWSAPSDFVFKVDPTTMLAMKEEGEKEIDFKQNNGFVSNHPKCQSCGGYARPAILMFGDRRWARGKSLWSPWRTTVDKMLRHNPSLSLVIVEIGCGKNVPSVRCMSEQMLDYTPQQCRVIRINRDFIQADFTLNPEGVLGIQGSGLPVLQAIDDVIQHQIGKARAGENLAAQGISQPAHEQQGRAGDEEIKNAEEDEELAYEMQVRANLEEAEC